MVAGALFTAPSALAQQGTSTSETAGQLEQQTIIHITKDGTNSYLIAGGSSSIGTFDTSYRIAGERSAVRASEELIITTITEDFRRSPTIGYVRAVTTTTNTGGTAQDTTTGATLPNPFATPEQITERITSELRRVIGSAENNTPQGQLVEIKCDFGMALDDMRCFHAPSVGERGGAEGTTRPPTNNTGGGGGNNTEPLTVSAMIDIDQEETSVVVFEAAIDGGTSPYTCEWELGDGTTVDTCNVSHIYENPGTYNASINVTDATGQNASDSTEPFAITNTTGGGGNNTEPLTVQAMIADIRQEETPWVLFEAAIDGGTSPYTCEWELGDGTTSDECGPNHVYQNTGNYTATVTVTDATGQTASDPTEEFAITNTGNNTGRLTVSAIIDIDQFTTPVVHFDTYYEGGVAPHTCLWDLGDGTTVDTCFVSHVYENPGTYTATVTVTDYVGQTASDATEPFTITNATAGGETTAPPPATNATAGGETTAPPPATNATTGGETTTPETAAPPPTTGEGEESTTTPPPPGTTAPNNQDVPLSDPDADRPAEPTTGEGAETTTSPAEPLNTLGQ
jgi:PKD repeat protein